jgi:methoxymalonate biosynthesis acyl carrier protein
MPEIRTAIRTFLAGFIRTNTLTDSTDIFATGFVNSMFAMQLLLFIEKNFALSVANDELDLANFRSIDAMTAFVERKLALKAVA